MSAESRRDIVSRLVAERDEALERLAASEDREKLSQRYVGDANGKINMLRERLAAAEACCKSHLARIAELESYTHGLAQTVDDLRAKLAAAEAEVSRWQSIAATSPVLCMKYERAKGAVG